MQKTICFLKRWVPVLGCFAVTSAAHATVPQDTYGAISKSNVFRLIAPDPVKQPANTAPLPRIIPTGIITFFAKRALFRVQWPAQPNTPPRDECFILSEGQRAGSIEVLQIDEKAGAIKFNNNGTIMLLSLEKDGGKPVPAPAQAPSPVLSSPFQASSQVPPSAKPLSAEEQTVLMEVERLRNADAIQKGHLPPLPPTALTPR